MIIAKRLSYVLSGLMLLQFLGMVLLTLFANTWLTSKSDNIVTLKLDTTLLEEKQKASQRALIDLDKYEATRVLLEKIVPKSKDQAKTIGELQKIAEETDVTISTITFPASELGNSSSNATVVGTTPTAAATDTNAVSQAKPVSNIPGLLGIEVSLSQIDKKGGASGSGMSYNQLISFLEAVEKNRRTMQIKTLQVLPIKSSTGSISGYSLTVTMNIFVKP